MAAIVERGGCVSALSNANVQAFLHVVREGESNHDDSAFTLINGGGHFTSFAHHPYAGLSTLRGGRAAGAFQHLPSTWAGSESRMGLTDFSPRSQEISAVDLIANVRHALDDVLRGDLQSAIEKCRQEWTSLPGASENNGRYTFARALEVFTGYGGKLGPQPAAPIEDRTQGSPMGIVEILAAFGPMLVDLLPKFAAIFKPQGEVANRNIAAAQVVLDTVVKATGSPNVQGAIEAMRQDDGARAAAQAALEADPAIMALVEVGGGVVAARTANVANSQVPLLRDRAFLVSMAILALVSVVVVTVAFKSPWFADWTADNRTTVLQSVLMALTAVTAFFLGSSWGSAKKDDAAAARAAQ
jgi:muramidase (phage lysozyme)